MNGRPSYGRISGPEVLRQTTKEFALRIIKLFRALPQRDDAVILGKQLLRARTSVAANYRSACRARSRAEFVSKLGIVVEEADETAFWLEMLIDAGIVRGDRLKALLAEANELIRVFSASRVTARSRRPIANHKSPIANT